MKSTPTLLSFTVLPSLRHVLFRFLDAICAYVYCFIGRPISGSVTTVIWGQGCGYGLIQYFTLNTDPTHCGQQKAASLGCRGEPAVPGLRPKPQLILLRIRL